MNKAIEEAAREYAEAMCPIGDYCGGVYDEQRNSDLPIYTDDAKSVLEWLFTKPLLQRLTDEERERVRKLYIDANDKLKSCLNAMSYNQISELDNEYKKGINMGLILALKYIFGKELFGEGEG